MELFYKIRDKKENEVLSIRKILFLGDSSETREFLQQARQEKFYIIVTDYFEPEHSTAKLLADEYWMISTGKLDILECKCRQNNIEAIISGASDYNIGMVIQLCKRLNLPCYCTEDVWYNCNNKEIFKKICKDVGVSIPTEYEVSTKLLQEEIGKVRFPVIVKPIDLCSSQGVSYCYNRDDLIKAYRYAEMLSKRDKIIVEQMLAGREFFAYYVLAEGKAAFLTLGVRLSQQGEPRFCYSMNISTNNFTNRYLNEMNFAVIEMLERHNCREGIVCVQCMMDSDDKFYALELCYSAEASILINPLRKVCDFDAIKWQFDCAVGIKHSVAELPNITGNGFSRGANSYILFSNKEGIVSQIEGIDKIESLPNVEVCMHVHIGDNIRKYYPLGHIMFDTDNYDQTCEIIRLINQNVYIKNTENEDVLIYFDDFAAIEKEYILE